MSGLRRTAKFHGKCIFILFIIIILGIIILTPIIIDKKENYTDLHKRVKILEDNYASILNR